MSKPALTEAFALTAGRSRTGKPLHVLGDMVTVKVASVDVGGRYCVIEIQSPPGGGTPMHVHHREDENFYVLEGEYTLHVGGHVHRAPAGSFLHAPREIPHRYENTGQSTGRLLMMAEPGGIDRMFEEFQNAVVAGRPDMDKIGEICRRYEIEFV